MNGDAVQNVYLIKDLARQSGHSVYTLKFYLKLGLIKESGRSQETRFRYFDDTTLATLSRIRSWRKQQKSLSEIQRLLSHSDESNQLAQGSGLWAVGKSPEPRAPSLERTLNI